MNRIAIFLSALVKWFFIVFLILFVFSLFAALFGSQIGVEFLDKVFAFIMNILGICAKFLDLIFGKFNHTH